MSKIDELLAVCDWQVNTVCAQCGVTVKENKMKYCGDGGDKNYSHRWKQKPTYQPDLARNYFPAALRCLDEVKRFAKLSADNLYPSAKIADMIERFEAGEV